MIAFQPLPDAQSPAARCTQAGGVPLWQDEAWRVIRAEDADFPAFYRVISRHHVAEFSALLAPGARRCMELVCRIERVLIEQLRPTKINPPRRQHGAAPALARDRALRLGQPLPAGGVGPPAARSGRTRCSASAWRWPSSMRVVVRPLSAAG